MRIAGTNSNSALTTTNRRACHTAAGKLVVKKRTNPARERERVPYEHAPASATNRVRRVTSVGSARWVRGVRQVGGCPLVELHELVDLGGSEPLAPRHRGELLEPQPARLVGGDEAVDVHGWPGTGGPRARRYRTQAMALNPAGIVTPEAVVLDFELAGLASRAVARLLDFLIEGVLILALAIVVGLAVPGTVGVIVDRHRLGAGDLRLPGAVRDDAAGPVTREDGVRSPSRHRRRRAGRRLGTPSSAPRSASSTS